MATAFAPETISAGLGVHELRAGMNIALTRFSGFSVVARVLRAPESTEDPSSVIVQPESSLFSKGTPHVVSAKEIDAGQAVIIGQQPPVGEAQVIEAHLQAIAANGPAQEERLF